MALVGCCRWVFGPAYFHYGMVGNLHRYRGLVLALEAINTAIEMLSDFASHQTKASDNQKSERRGSRRCSDRQPIAALAVGILVFLPKKLVGLL